MESGGSWLDWEPVDHPPRAQRRRSGSLSQTISQPDSVAANPPIVELTGVCKD